MVVHLSVKEYAGTYAGIYLNDVCKKGNENNE